MGVVDSAKILSVPTTSGDSDTKDDKKGDICNHKEHIISLITKSLEITESGDDKVNDVPADNQSGI